MSLASAFRAFSAAAIAALSVHHRAAAAPHPPPASFGLDWQVFECDADHFTVRVPPEWKEIPAYNMQTFISGAAAQSFLQDQQFAQNYKYGFQQGPIQEWFQPPYFLIDIHSRGRTRQRDLEQMTRVEDVLPGGGPFREDGTRGVFSNTPVGTFLYEPGINAIWLHFQHGKFAGEPIQAVAVLLLTQKGGIQMNFYARDAEFTRCADLFERIARSSVVQEYARYRTPMLETWPLFELLDWTNPAMRYLEMTIVLVFLAGFAGLTIVLVQRAHAEEANPLNPIDEEDDS